jgi:hypothetical protein
MFHSVVELENSKGGIAQSRLLRMEVKPNACWRGTLFLSPKTPFSPRRGEAFLSHRSLGEGGSEAGSWLSFSIKCASTASLTYPKAGNFCSFL